MAGIGFVLRKLAAKDDFIGVIRAYFHSAVAAVGPWIFLVSSLGIVSFFTHTWTGYAEVNEFFAVLIYNLLFSFIFSAPLYMVAARYVADCLFGRNAAPVPGIMLQCRLYLLCASVPFATLFYFFYAVMSPFETILSIVNFALLCEIWFTMLFLSCIRNFRAITFSWLFGIIVSTILGIYLGKRYASTGMLFGMNAGLVVIFFSIQANILAEYPYRFLKPKEFRFYFSHYKGLFWTGLMLFLGLWIDKVVMWFAKEAYTHMNNLTTYPIYDGAMFYSYLTIVPGMALFIFSLETNFYDSYIQYIRNIESNAPFSFIEQHKNQIIKQIKENGRNFLVLQGSLSLVVLISAPFIFTYFNLNYLEFGIFRLGVLGALFASFNFFIIIIFSYFDSQENLLFVTAFMLVSNFLFSIVTLYLGFEYYGFGYALSMIVSFFVSSILFFKFLRKLTFHVFISNVVKRVKVTTKREFEKRFDEKMP